MARRYIEFISAYCDRWCERCAFTERCSAFAVHADVAMCDGDEDAAIELAVGTPRQPGNDEAQARVHERMAPLLDGYVEPSEQELEELGREIEARRERVRQLGLAKSVRDYSVAAHRWRIRREKAGDSDDPGVREAIEVVGWDSTLIHAKVMRALDGRDENPDLGVWRSLMQNDWNGSAKVALISIERSERAWHSIAAVSGNEGASTLAGMLATIRQGMHREFPRAMEFHRPGFDDQP